MHKPWLNQTPTVAYSMPKAPPPRQRSSDHLSEGDIVQVIHGDRVMRMQVWVVDGNYIKMRGLPE